MSKLDQSIFNKVFGATGLGMVGWADKSNPIKDLSQIQKFQQEEIEWIGKCDVSVKVLDPSVSVYMARRHNDHVFLGVSPYRLIMATDEKKMRFRSYWWEVVCDEQYYSEGNLQFKGLFIDPPLFRSAPLLRDILIHINAVQMDGSQKRVDEIMLFDLAIKVGTKKYKSGTGQIVSDRMISSYNQRIPVTCEQLYEWLNTGEVKTAKTISSKEIEQPEPVVKENEKQKLRNLGCGQCGKPIEKDWKTCPYCGEPITNTCPQCGKTVEPDWKACPYCGSRLKT